MQGDIMDRFHNLIKDQFQYGGKKYSLNDARESTDQLIDDFGIGWLYGTMGKYCKRFKNLQRERDILKMACYCYILWLKKGFFIKSDGLRHDMLDTKVEMKDKYFQVFIDRLDKQLLKWQEKGLIRNLENNKNKIDAIYEVYILWNDDGWDLLKEDSIFRVYFLLFLEWFNRYSKVKDHDTDTKN